MNVNIEWGNLSFALGGLMLAIIVIRILIRSYGSRFIEATGGLMKKAKEDKEKRLEKAKQIALTLILISASLFLGNWLCAEIGWEWWWAYWRNGPFILSQITIVFSVYFLMVSKSAPSRLFAWALLGIVFIGWVSVANRFDSGKEALSVEADKITRMLAEPAEVIEKVLVQKGEIYKVQKVDLRAVSMIPIWVRYDERGEFKRQDPRDWNRPGGINSTDSYVRTIEILSKDEAFYVTVRKR